MKKDIKDLILFPILFIFFILSDLLYLIPVYFFKIDITKLSKSETILINLVIESIVAIVLIIIYRTYLIEKWHNFKNNFNKYFDIALRAWIVGLSGMMVTNLILNLFNNDIAANETAVQSIIETSPVMALILTTILAPFVEEMIFRKSLKDMIPINWLYIICSGLIFGYLHVMSSENLFEYLYIIPYGCLGASFAYIMTKTDNVFSTIAMHMLHNGILTLLSIMVIL